MFDELCSMLDGGDPKKTELKKGSPNVVMFVGLQGEGRGRATSRCTAQSHGAPSSFSERV